MTIIILFDEDTLHRLEFVLSVAQQVLSGLFVKRFTAVCARFRWQYEHTDMR